MKPGWSWSRYMTQTGGQRASQREYSRWVNNSALLYIPLCRISMFNDATVTPTPFELEIWDSYTGVSVVQDQKRIVPLQYIVHNSALCKIGHSVVNGWRVSFGMVMPDCSIATQLFGQLLKHVGTSSVFSNIDYIIILRTQVSQIKTPKQEDEFIEIQSSTGTAFQRWMVRTMTLVKQVY